LVEVLEGKGILWNIGCEGTLPNGIVDRFEVPNVNGLLLF
jgi:hypothetical protein